MWTTFYAITLPVPVVHKQCKFRYAGYFWQRFFISWKNGAIFYLHDVNFWLSCFGPSFRYNLVTIGVLEFVVVIDVYAQPTREKIKFYRTASYASGPGDAASACRLDEAVGAGDQGAVRSPQRDDVSGSRRCPLVEPPRRGFVRVPEDHLADLAARSPPLAARDAVFAAFLQRCHAKLIQINSGSLMFTLS